jgi:predicted DNA-binding transcriptional regulator YafY
LYQEAARGALAKLDNVLPDEQRREVAWARRTLVASGIRWTDPGVSAPHLEKLRDAARGQRRVRMSYRGRSQPEPLQRDLDPYKLVHVWGWQYCIGYCHLRQAIRSFRLDRILDVTLLDQTFEAPVDFDLQAYITSEPFFQPKVQAKLYFAPESALIPLDNQAFWETVEEQPDGSVIVTFSTPDLDWAAGVVLRYCYPGVVLEPQELRDLVQERARAIADQYDSTNQMKVKS